LENFRSQSALRAKIKILEEGIQSVENWHVNWREHFRYAKLGQSLIVLPPWESSIELSGSQPVCGLTTDKVLEPEIIFRHPQTLEMLEQYLFEADTFSESMIDLGIG